MTLERKSTSEQFGKAEEARTKGDFAKALELTKKALEDQPLTEEELKEVVENQVKTALVAEGARLIFGAEKSLLKRSKTPWEFHNRASSLLREVGTPLYKNDTFRNAAEPIKRNANETRYLFDLEIARDIADYMTTLAILFPGDEGDQLTNSSKHIWDSIVIVPNIRLGEKAFFNLERDWFLYKTGMLDEIKPVDSAFYLEALYSADGDKNLDRIATVATRVLTIAKGIDVVGLAPIAENILATLESDHPDYFKNKTETSAAKSRKEYWRNTFVQFFAPTSGFPRLGSRTKLFNDATALGTYQQERFNATKPQQ